MTPPHVSAFVPHVYASDWHVSGTQPPLLLPEELLPLPEPALTQSGPSTPA
jgi:hypothetical protein